LGFIAELVLLISRQQCVHNSCFYRWFTEEASAAKAESRILVYHSQLITHLREVVGVGKQMGDVLSPQRVEQELLVVLLDKREFQCISRIEIDPRNLQIAEAFPLVQPGQWQRPQCSGSQCPCRAHQQQQGHKGCNPSPSTWLPMQQ